MTDVVLLLADEPVEPPCCFVCQDSQPPLVDCASQYRCTCRGIWVHPVCWEQYQQRFRTCPWCRNDPDSRVGPRPLNLVWPLRLYLDVFLEVVLFVGSTIALLLFVFVFDAVRVFRTYEYVLMLLNSAWPFFDRRYIRGKLWLCWAMYVTEMFEYVMDWNDHQALSVGLQCTMGLRCFVMVVHGWVRPFVFQPPP